MLLIKSINGFVVVLLKINLIVVHFGLEKSYTSVADMLLNIRRKNLL